MLLWMLQCRMLLCPIPAVLDAAVHDATVLNTGCADAAALMAVQDAAVRE